MDRHQRCGATGADRNAIRPTHPRRTYGECRSWRPLPVGEGKSRVQPSTFALSHRERAAAVQHLRERGTGEGRRVALRNQRSA